MKHLSLCVMIAAALAAPALAEKPVAPGLAGVKTVYLLPMAYGMDQHLANHLTQGQILQVTTDPKNADAILTDHLGTAFENQVKDLFAEPKPPEEKAAAGGDKSEGKSDAKPDDKSASKDSGKPASRGINRDMKMVGDERAHVPSSRARGMVFLVKRGSWEVLWSAYREPEKRRGKDLDRTAGHIADQLKNTLKRASAPAPESK